MDEWMDRHTDRQTVMHRFECGVEVNDYKVQVFLPFLFIIDLFIMTVELMKIFFIIFPGISQG